MTTHRDSRYTPLPPQAHCPSIFPPGTLYERFDFYDQQLVEIVHHQYDRTDLLQRCNWDLP